MNARSEQLAPLWRGGVPLDQAWFQYAPRDQRDELNALPGFHDALSASVPAGDLQQISQQLLRAVGNSQAIIEKQLELREQLLDQLFASELMAIGYQTAPRPSGKLECINPDYFDAPEIDWRNSSLTTVGFKYENVRVVLRDDDLSILPEAKQKIGRPSRASEIQAAMNSIAARDPNFCTHTVKVAVQQVRDQLNCSGNEKGVRDKTLEKYISLFCRGK